MNIDLSKLSPTTKNKLLDAMRDVLDTTDRTITADLPFFTPETDSYVQMKGWRDAARAARVIVATERT